MNQGNQPDRSTNGEARGTTPRSVTMPLAHELGGDLPCVRCRYNLKGLSIRAVCPECGTPVRATLLAVVDPLASELRPIYRPGLTSLGVVVWPTSAMLACIAAWSLKLAEYSTTVASALGDLTLIRWAVPLLAALSAAGALVLIAPHDGIPPRSTRAAASGVACYAPLVAILWWLSVARPALLEPNAGPMGAPSGLRALLGILLCGTLCAVLILLRPNARILAARSLLMRSGRVDRQTMRTVAAVLGFCIAGYLAGLLAGGVPGPALDTLGTVGGLLLLVGWSLFTLGLAGIVYDCWRLRPVIAEPPLSLTALLSPDRADRSPRPSRVWSRQT